MDPLWTEFKKNLRVRRIEPLYTPTPKAKKNKHLVEREIKDKKEKMDLKVQKCLLQCPHGVVLNIFSSRFRDTVTAKARH